MPKLIYTKTFILYECSILFLCLKRKKKKIHVCYKKKHQYNGFHLAANRSNEASTISIFPACEPLSRKYFYSIVCISQK